MLKTLLREQQGRIERVEREIERLKAQIDKLRRMLFGQSSEKQRLKTGRQLQQAEKQLAALETQLRTTRSGLPETNAAEPSPPKVAHPGRKPLPAGLPRETRVIPPGETVCPKCGGELKPLSDSVSEQPDIIRSAFKVIETVRPKLACCRCDHIVQTTLPVKPIARGYAAPGLLARIIMAKFCRHLPLYRQSEIYARQGVELSRNTPGSWVDEMGHTLRPLYEALYSYVLMAGKVHADDTPVNVLAPGGGKTRTGRLWVYLRDDRCAGSSLPAAVWFTYTPDRKGIHPQRHLAGYSGVLQADAYAGYDALYEDGRITEAACMAHAR
ncbi:IS66 family transposase, partial [Kosakonia sp. S42]|nr:IS66 family transposase [Kosakonia sp. S42]